MRRVVSLLLVVVAAATGLVWPGAPVSAATVVFRPVGFGFENPVLAAGTSSEGMSTIAWTFTGQAGIARSGSTYTTAATPLPQGDQVGYVRNAGRINRPIGVKPGDVVRIAATQRRSNNTGNQGLGIYIDGVLQGSVVTPSATGWQTYRIPLTIAREGAVTLEIRGTTTAAGQDRTALVDSVAIERQGWTVDRPPFVDPGPRVYASVPPTGLPEERRSIVRTISEQLAGGVAGLRTEGDTEPDVQSMVLAFAEWNDRIYVGGKFASVQPGAGTPLVSQSYLAAFDRTTGAWISSFRPKLNGTVWDLAVSPEGVLFVGGQFTTVNNTTAVALTALDAATGQRTPGWHADASLSGSSDRPMVRALDLEGTWLYVGGNFTKIVGGAGNSAVSAGRLGRVTVSDGRPGGAFAPNVNGQVIDIDATPDRIHVAGHFSMVNGTNRRSMASLSGADGSLVTGLKPILQTSTDSRNHYMQGVLQVGDRLWVNGSQHTTQVYRASDTSLVRSFVSEPNGDGQALATVNGIVYGGSHANRRTYLFTDVGSWPPIEAGTRTDTTAWVGAWDAWSTRFIPWMPDLYSKSGEGAWELFVDSRRCLWIGGDFNRGATVNGVARFVGGFAKHCPADDAPPTTPGSPTRTVLAKGVRLAWTASTDNKTATPTYEVVRNGRVIASNIATTTFTDTTGTAGDRYVVRSADAAGNRSASTIRLG